MKQIEQNETIVKYFSKLKYSGNNHNYHNRSATKKILVLQCFSTNFSEAQSDKHYCIIDWNNFKKQCPTVTPLERTNSAVEALIKKSTFSATIKIKLKLP